MALVSLRAPVAAERCWSLELYPVFCNLCHVIGRWYESPKHVAWHINMEI